ncbi:MAG: ribosome-binding factor A [Alphaproteobacteria bacterium]|jgi:ribosome-binding factor A|nr:ribosome-binding factor A [Alphaproteobacteria bacterium]
MTKALSQRQRKVGETLRHILAEVLLRGDYPPVTVTQVVPSPDLRHARVYVFAPGDMGQALDALAAGARALQAAINRGARLKFTPRLTFVADTSFGEAERIEAILREIGE